MTATSATLAPFVNRVLPWFAANARDLPWRATRDPYAIWVSEVMLQQTQVKTVIPYWQRWMRALPTIESLAKCRTDRVLKLWEGLGYYHRARNLQNAARMIVERHGSRFPQRFEEVLQLPGIGRYTAGAVCSITFNTPAPVLDGNAIRVLARFFGVRGDPRNAKVNQQLWELAEALVTHAAQQPTNSAATSGNCSAFNQGLMELGATVCTAATPDCHECPVARDCFARKTRRVHALPESPKRRKPEERRFVAVVIENRGRLFLRRRPNGVVNAHLWEFPNAELSMTEKPANVARRMARVDVQQLCTIRHSITRYRMTLEAFHGRAKPPAEPRSATRNSNGGRWFSLRQATALAFPSAHRKVLEHARLLIMAR
jgi:A/G-specific adenine glycosylase